MGNNQTTANQIKAAAYQYYANNAGQITFKDSEFIDKFILNEEYAPSYNAFNTIYQKDKLFDDDNNLATYAKSPESVNSANAYYKLLNSEYQNTYLQMKKNENGEFCNEFVDENLFKATIMYLLSSNEVNGQPFDKFYEVLNGKIADDEVAFIGYLTRGYANLNDKPITSMSGFQR